MWVFFGRITRDLPRGRAQVGDRHLKFHETWDNLENRVTLCDLQVLVDEAAEPVSSEHADCRLGTWRGAACGRSLIE